MRRSTAKKLFAPQLNECKAAEIEQTISRFNEEMAHLDDCYITKRKASELRSKWNIEYQRIKVIHITAKHPLYNLVKDFFRDYEHLDRIIATHNKKHIASEMAKSQMCLNDVAGKAMDDQQRQAIVTDEDRNLVIAGAGSGKTLTIVGKVKYLCEVKKIAPEDILMISFTRKAAAEMAERASAALQDKKVSATTFHKLGMDIITEANCGKSKKRPEVYEDVRGVVEQYIESKIKENKTAVKNLLEYFAYYLHIPADIEKYETLGDAFDAEKGADLETLKGKYERAAYIGTKETDRKADKQTLQGEQVKSIEEVTIANFLFLNGIEYEYERLYPFEQDNPHRKAYRPDFYLPEYDLYLEHFGINKDGKLPWLSPVEEEKYQEGIRWKRGIHKANHTTLLETYSFYSSEGRLLNELQRMLEQNCVQFKPRDFTDVFEKTYGSMSGKYCASFIDLCSTFITLFKSRGHSIRELHDLKYPSAEFKSQFYTDRKNLFLDIIEDMMKWYQEVLKSQNAIDFADMINMATAKIMGGYRTHPYKWVIVDEFQDVSVAQSKLLKEILDCTGAKLFCVGDDWQSIFRFAGSDISLFTGFETHFGAANITYLSKIYRNSKDLTLEAAHFVMKNKQQCQKRLSAETHMDYPIVFMCYNNSPMKMLQKSLDKIIQTSGPNATILLLCRTVYDADIVLRPEMYGGEPGSFRVIRENGEQSVVYDKSPQTPISLMTIHRAKGIEADNVILVNFRNADLGFPNKIADDPLLDLVLTTSDRYPYAEERRLLYVALTRTMNRVYILVDKDHPSEFFKEFKYHRADKSVFFLDPDGAAPQAGTVMCPKCKTGRLVVRENSTTGTAFVGCSHFPQCDFFVQDPRVLEKPKLCPNCGGLLVEKRSSTGTFYGCTNFPMCRHTEEA